MSNASSNISLRPMERADEEAVIAFTGTLDEHDLLFVSRDLSEPRVVRAWLDAVHDGRIHSHVVFVDGEIAGYSALVSDPLSWSPHVGEIRIMVGEKWRRRNIGRLLAEAAFDKAVELGLEKIIARMTVDQHGAIALFEEMGFRGEALLRDYVRTKDGRTYDLAFLSHDVETSSMRRSMLGLNSAGTE